MICPVCASGNLRGSGVCQTCGAALSAQGAGRASHVLPLGTKLQQGNYTVGRVLGQGGFGITYVGGDRTLRCKVAIKELFLRDECVRHGAQVMIPTHARVPAADFDRAKQRFVEEARTVARFNHPGIAGVRTMFEENGTAYMVMEYVHGRTLGELLEANGGVLSEPAAVSYVSAVGPALKQLHQKGVLHRDLNPTNVVMTDDGLAVLVDFGAAREFTADMTRNFSVFLTEGYAPLEQYGSRARLGAYTDVHALGATLYHLLTGRVPVRAPDRINGITLTEPRRVNVRVSAKVSEVVMKSMAIRATDRYQSVEEFLKGLTP